MPESTLFDDEFMNRLNYLTIVSKHMIPGHLHGEHRAKKKTDSGIEFVHRTSRWLGEFRHKQLQTPPTFSGGGVAADDDRWSQPRAETNPK